MQILKSKSRFPNRPYQFVVLPEKVTRKHLGSPEKDTYTHQDMSGTWHHCNLVRYYHTGSAQKSIFDLEGSTTERGSKIHLRYWSLLQLKASQYFRSQPPVFKQSASLSVPKTLPQQQLTRNAIVPKLQSCLRIHNSRIDDC